MTNYKTGEITFIVGFSLTGLSDPPHNSVKRCEAWDPTIQRLTNNILFRWVVYKKCSIAIVKVHCMVYCNVYITQTARRLQLSGVACTAETL